MADPVGVDLEFDISGHPAGTGGTISLDVVASASLEIPGLKLSVDKLRASLALGLELSGGQIRLIPPALALAEPEGMGAELDLPGFEGGGYLAHDHATGEWRGALAAQLGVISVSGFAILGNEPSFLVLIAAEFTPAIQLSFGFTLVGVGGLVGINRRPNTDALSAAVTSGDLSKLLFPSDPIAQADHLLASLSQCFPAQPGSFVVGPMLKLGWGTPTLVAATIGVVVSDAGVMILGRIAITLPFEELAIIRLEALVLGVIDADGLAIDASLANSNIVGIPVEGDIRLRALAGPHALFALSAGGFHPAFAPPDGMAGMRRIGAEISPGPILRARLEAYLAVTTASVQFGAHVELEAGVGGFGIKGHLDFDALFVFDPFGFMIDFSAGVSVECADFSVASIELSGHLSGTSPWRIRGHASISILWWDVDVDVPEITWGDADPPPLPPARDPAAVLAHELGSAANWAALSREVPHLVQLRPGVEIGHVALHPLAEFGFSQNAVPIDLPLQRMDGVKLGAPVTLRVASKEQPTPVQMSPAQFVAGQFLDLDANAKLASAGYATYDGGFALDAVGARHGEIADHDEDYETTVLGKDETLVFRRRLALLDGVRVGAGHYATPPDVRQPLLTVRDPAAAAVAKVTDLTNGMGEFVSVAAATGAASTNAAAQAMSAATDLYAGQAQAMVSALAARDGAAADLQVVHAWEVQ
jgi:hypothetical protein